MKNRRTFLKAGTALAGISTLLQADTDENQGLSIYIRGMVWNRQLPAPMNDWLIRLDAKADIPGGNTPPPVTPGVATMGDDFHDGVGLHVDIQTAALHGNQLTLTGVVTESKTASLTAQSVRIEGKLAGTSVQSLTVTIGSSTFNGAGLVVIAIIAILIR